MPSSNYAENASFPHEVTVMLERLLLGIEEALRDNLVGVYLRGSLALGDFDSVTSDLDFLAVTKLPVSEGEFTLLNAMHTRLAKLSNTYAEHIEGAYMDRAALTRFRVGEWHPTIERGDVLQLREHHANWVLERWIVREHGIRLVGPDPKALIEPISSEEVRAAVSVRLRDWADWANQPDDPDWRLPLSHKAYVVETMCRAMYTLMHSKLCSKPSAIAWALETFPEPWRDLVQQSQAWRRDTARPDPAIVAAVVRFVNWATCNATG